MSIRIVLICALSCFCSQSFGFERNPEFIADPSSVFELFSDNDRYLESVRYFEYQSNRGVTYKLPYLDLVGPNSNGQTLVIHSGVSKTMKYWLPSLGHLLNKGYRVVLMDQTNVGLNLLMNFEKTSGGVFVPTTQDDGKEAVRLIRHLDLENFHLIGHSRGAHVALHSAIELVKDSESLVAKELKSIHLLSPLTSIQAIQDFYAGGDEGSWIRMFYTYANLEIKNGDFRELARELHKKNSFPQAGHEKLFIPGSRQLAIPEFFRYLGVAAIYLGTADARQIKSIKDRESRSLEYLLSRLAEMTDIPVRITSATNDPKYAPRELISSVARKYADIWPEMLFIIVGDHYWPAQRPNLLAESQANFMAFHNSPKRALNNRCKLLLQ